MVDLLTKYRETRLAKFHFYDAMVFIEENNLEGADIALNEMLKNFEETFSKYPSEHYSFIFLIVSIFIYFIFFVKKNKKILTMFFFAISIFFLILTPHLIWLFENQKNQLF